MKHKIITLAMVAALGAGSLGADVPGETPADVESRLSDLVGAMTLEEKVAALSSGFNYNSPKRLGVADVQTTDGPLGVASWGLRGRATAFPAALTLAATWRPELARLEGEAFARECRARGLDVFYGPGVNLSRSSKSSRNFEYFGEDPVLTSLMAVPFIQGLQDGGVVAVVKHFAGNDQEFDRYLTNSVIDERTLRELYLRPFMAAIIQGGAKGVMTGYNLLNGDYCAQNRWLLTDVLRREWGFDGTVMSDWGATHACLESIEAGLDMELGGNDFYNFPKIKALLDSAKISEEQIDRMVAHIYRPLMQLGIFDRIGQADPSLALFSPENNRVALDIAREGIVLTKNDGNLLPLATDRPLKIAVIGPNAAPDFLNDRVYSANRAVWGGGGSSRVNPYIFTGDLEGIIAAFPQAEVTYVEGIGNDYRQRLYDRTGVVNFLEGTSYADAGNGTDTPADQHWTTTITPARTDSLRLFVKAQGGWQIAVDGLVVADRLSAPGISDGYASIPATAGIPIEVALTYRANNCNPREMRFGWDYASAVDFSPAVKAAREADVVIVSAGFDSAEEYEGTDRTFDLPFGQAELISAVADANPHTVVILRGGGGMATEAWIDKVPAVIFAGYPGQEGGKALAEIISGKVNPSGKLPFSFERRWEDSPVYGRYDEQRDTRRLEYTEGLFMGYRGHDHTGVAPLWPFGHGLSYSQFRYSDPEILPQPDSTVTVSFNITNTSDRPGFETAQVYVCDMESSAPRPAKELKGFGKAYLEAGETVTMRINLPIDAFAFWQPDMRAWVVEPGAFRIFIGPSAGDLPLHVDLTM